jgi:glycosyltransferase involved in cell wall biosynthesis
MKKIVINLGVFGEHGIDQACLHFLNAIPKDEYCVVLHQLYELEKKSRLTAELQDCIEIKVAVPKNSILGKIHFYRRKNLFFKLIDGFSILFLQNAIYKSLDNLAPDILIDYDTSLQKVIHRFSNTSASLIHFSPTQMRAGRRGSLKRLGNRLVHYSKIILLCEEMRNQAIQLWPKLEHQFIVIPNPVDLSKIIDKAMYEVKLPENVRINNYLVSVGRLTEQKNFTLLVQSYKLAFEQGLDWPLLIIGDGDERIKIEKLVSQHKLNMQIYLLGNLENPYPYIKNSGAFVLSSNYEGLPVVLIEAMALESPIISTRCPTGPSDILEHGKLGLLVDVNNVGQLSNAMLQLCGNPSLRESLKSRAKMASRHYEADSIASKIMTSVTN